MPRLLILKTGSTVPDLISRRGDFEAWFRAGLGLGEDQAPVIAAHEGEALPDPASVPAAVVTGSPAMVTDDADWSRRCEGWLAELVARDVPVLGVCYGHQLLARALGGAVGDTPAGREIGTVRIGLTEEGRRDRLFEGLSDPVTGHATHSQSVLELPPGAVRLAGNDHDPNQAFRCGARAWGVQFHPEFDADIVRGYLAARREQLAGEGLDPEALAASARDSDDGPILLRNFRALLETVGGP